MEITRRKFIGGAVGVVGAAALTAAGCAKNGAGADVNSSLEATSADKSWGNAWSGPGSADGSWTGTPEALKALGGSNMPLDEVNRRRKLYIDAQTDYKTKDGKIIPALMVKFRAIANTYGYGVGSNLNDECFGFFEGVTDDEIQAYLDMPWGQQFTLMDYSIKSGRPIKECEDYCEKLYRKIFVTKVTDDNGTRYGHFQFSPTGAQYRMAGQWGGMPSGNIAKPPFGTDYGDEVYDKAGTPWLPPAPASANVVKGAIYPYDDVRALIRQQNLLSVEPCLCKSRYYMAENKLTKYPGWPQDPMAIKDARLSSKRHPEGIHVECCLTLGSAAQEAIDLRAGRRITADEAIAIIDRGIAEGSVLQRMFTKQAECVCLCAAESCTVIQGWKAVGKKMDLSKSNAFRQVSHYNIEVNLDSCIKCGKCATMCNMDAITMDGTHNGQSGYPKVSSSCFRCGVCATTCPQKARQLVLRPKDQIREFPNTYLDEANEKAGYRFEHGLIY